MRRREGTWVRGVLGAAAGLLLLAGSAHAAKEPTCGPRATLLRIEEKICPANDRRPAIVRQRACCLKPGGRVRCGHFQHCPRNSPS